jgi:hypothetical protein
VLLDELDRAVYDDKWDLGGALRRESDDALSLRLALCLAQLAQVRP